MRIMMIAGEASGDLHGAGVVRELKKRDPSIDIFGIGGDRMSAAGMNLVYHVREVSVMGFAEVVRHLPVIRSVERTLEALLIGRRPDVLVLIDYPGFNLRFAAKARKRGIKTVYYISPQVWAWNPGRVKKMKGVIDAMFVVFPFEVAIYKKSGIDVEFVGHPLLEVLGEAQSRKEFLVRYELDPSRPIVGLFPGSRRQEVERIFPSMLGAAEMLMRERNVQVVVGAASILAHEFVKSFVREGLNVRIVQNATYDVMANSDVALVTSGTATLETACFQTPMVVVYKTSWLSYIVGRLLIRIKNIGLVNIVAGKTIVPELVQHEVEAARLARAASNFLDDQELRSKTSQELALVRARLGKPGASARVAEGILAIA
jgi:lipid-A-disaccharide synthase